MSDIPNALQYTRSHEWVREESNETYAVGITDHAQHLLGDIVYVDLPDVARKVEAGTEISVVESVKAAADVYSPLSGEVVEVNERLLAEPQLVNTSPYGDGWLFKLKLTDKSMQGLLDAQAYQAHIEA